MRKTLASVTSSSLRPRSTKRTASSRDSAWWKPGFPSPVRKMTMYMASPSVGCETHLRGRSGPLVPLAGAAGGLLGQEGQVHHVAVGGEVRGVAGEECGRGGRGLPDDGQVVGRHDLVAGDD